MQDHQQKLDHDALLANAGWLRGLARDLARDGEHADDLVQSVWLAALEKPPRAAGEERSLRAWLASVLRKRWANEWRSSQRRERRECDVARGEQVPASSDSSERLELQRRVIAALMLLTESDREIVVMRYFDELPPREIARKLGITDSAMRTRLSRALDKLKARLDAEFGGERRVWAIELVALVLKPSSVGWFVPLRFAAAGALLASLAAVAYIVASRSDDIGASSASDEATLAAVKEPAPNDASANSPAETRIEVNSPTAIEQPSSKNTTTTAREELMLVGRVIDERDAPISGARVVAVTMAGQPNVETDADGRYSVALDFESVATGMGGQLELRAEAAGYAWWTWRVTPTNPGELPVRTIVLRPGGSIVGRAVDQDGVAVAGARVSVRRAVIDVAPRSTAMLRAFGNWVPLEGSEHSVQTRDDGSFSLDGVPATALAVFLSKSTHLWGIVASCTVPAGGVFDVGAVEIPRAEKSNSIAGVVLGFDGTPMVGARVSLTHVGDIAGDSSMTSATTNDTGRFEVRAVENMDFRLNVRAPRGKSGRATLAPVSAGADDVQIKFARSNVIEIFVTDVAGTPLETATILVSSPDGRGILSNRLDLEVGRHSIEVPFEPFELSVTSHGHRRAKLGPFEPDSAPEQVRFTLERLDAFRGGVFANGAPLAGARVHLHQALRARDEEQSLSDGFAVRVDPRLATLTVSTDVDGQFELAIPHAGSWFVHAEADGFARAELGPLVNVEGGANEPLALHLRVGGAIEGRLLVAGGVDLAGEMIGASNGDGHVQLVTLASDGVYRFDDLPAGPHQVLRCDASEIDRLGSDAHQRSTGRTPAPWSIDVIPGATVRFDIDARHEVPSRIDGRLVIDGQPAAGWSAIALGPRAHEDRCNLDPNGAFVLRMAEPGFARLWLSEASRLTPRVTITCEMALEAPVTSLELELSTGTIELDGLDERSSGLESNDARAKLGPNYLLMVQLGGRRFWSASDFKVTEGHAVIERVPAGRVVLRRSEGSRALPSSPAVGEVDLRAGETRRIEQR